MESSPQLCRVATLLFFSFFVSAVEAQIGFISLDCGLPEGDDYDANSTGISYISDAKYVRGGQPKTVNAENLSKRYQTLRAFPGSEGDRNCYDLQPLQAGAKYLVRAYFLYGNYDGQSSPPEFELHVGVNAKITVGLSQNETDFEEVVAVAHGNKIWVCLVNSGKGSPIVSAIELRPLLQLNYPANVSQSLFLQRRLNLGSELGFRYPADAYDRLWLPVRGSLAINSSSVVKTTPEDGFRVPSIVMQTAAVTANVSYSFFIRAAVGSPTDTVFFALHFAELQNITNSNQTRSMDIYGLGSKEVGLQNYTAPYLLADSIGGSGLEIGPSQSYNISISASNTSTLPPFLNALETFIVLKSGQLPTFVDDVAAVEDIKEEYKIERNWEGDPCVPEAFAWRGVGCSYLDSSPARIVTLNLSSIGITGDIPSSIVNLTTLTTLDLSNNQISIKTLDLLAKLPSLTKLNLSGIKILGSSQAFCNQALNGPLSSRIQGLQALCSPSEPPSSTPSTNHKDNSSVSNKINSLVSVIMLLLLLSFTV